MFVFLCWDLGIWSQVVVVASWYRYLVLLLSARCLNLCVLSPQLTGLWTAEWGFKVSLGKT